jgi:DNA-binding transcriptional MerR regulator
MSDRLDRIEALLEGHGMAIADIHARQEVMQQQQQRMQEQQQLTQNQIESIAALVHELREAAFYTMEVAKGNGNRLVRTSSSMN